MKKCFASLCSLCLSTMLLSGCASCGNGCGKKEDVYSKLNNLLSESFVQVELTASECFNDISLESTYLFSYTANAVNVKYTIERLNELSLDSAFEQKYKISGEALIMGGKVVTLNGQSADIGAVKQYSGLNFKEEYFTNAKSFDTYFMADVRDADGFMGTEVDCAQMNVFVSFTDSISEILIKYKRKNGEPSEYWYVFHKTAE